MQLSRRLMLFFMTILAVGGACAQAWPTKPVRVVVPFAAGGPADGLARFLGVKMTADLGQPLLVDNKGGAGGTIGAAEVAKSAADGYTLLFSSTGALVIFPALSTSLTYNPDKDLVAVGHAVNSPLVIVTHAKSPFKTLGDLVKFDGMFYGVPHGAAVADNGGAPFPSLYRNRIRRRNPSAHPCLIQSGIKTAFAHRRLKVIDSPGLQGDNRIINRRFACRNDNRDRGSGFLEICKKRTMGL